MAEPTDTAEPSSPDRPDQGLDIELLLRQARAYLEFGEQIQSFSTHFEQTAQSGDDWSAALAQHFEQLQAALAGAAHDSDSVPGLAQFWTVTLDAWRNAAAAVGIPATATAVAGADQPAWREYQAVQTEYLALLRQTSRAALELLEQRLRARATADAPVDTLRGLYNLWVECNEETYGQMLRGAEYGVMNARLLNALLGCYRPGDAAP